MPKVLVQDEPSKHQIQWKRAEFHRLDEFGFLCGNYELVQGTIVKMPQNMPHASVVMEILLWLVEIVGRGFVVTQASIDVSPQDNPTNEPMPDVLVLTQPAATFSQRPTPQDIRLLVEVSDTTLRFDMTTKASLYARATIAEYWVVSLPDQTLIVHREPQDGTYSQVITYHQEDEVAPLAAPNSPVLVSRFFEPAPLG